MVLDPPETVIDGTAAPSDPKRSLASTSILFTPLSCVTSTTSSNAVGVEASITVTVTAAIEASPLASVIV